jgi:hypothetical protein
MPQVDYENIAIVGVKDAEAGLFHLFANVEGALVPIATQKLGSVLAWIDNAKSDEPTQTPAVSSPLGDGGNSGDAETTDESKS